jgi:hypothetical protein
MLKQRSLTSTGNRLPAGLDYVEAPDDMFRCIALEKRMTRVIHESVGKFLLLPYSKANISQP